ncbi:hypothetical protein LOZ12_005480 [Ophidiomyces ophidiicola]|nr:hypothetical protein LOZ62_002637 [Ophidiomyces ophidiicola]KAI2054010.1 hypothetical protein LOZ38_001539 [Ophidiomyces ophidiicola]KAI2070693.1 hypothetical protein LOZ37_004883 [Ophidiomyces ophidiicola]KAI2076719.1 hypothetical protein LOZ39_002623 [Ophidiomyces ophidiicola]KAI2090359.1 hypothetical protein LOZ35_005255 [Ophidiomyces ophidiicola]
MRFSSLFPPGNVSLLGPSHLLSLLIVPLVQSTLFTPVPSPQLDLGPLGRITLTGNFDAISLFTFQQQRDEVLAVYNGSQSQSLIAPLPNGGLAPISSADADILALCPLKSKDGALTALVVGGNFTSLGGTESQALALFDTQSGKVSAIPNLSGRVSALLCDSDKVYVGGDFKRSNSSNAISWSRDSGFSNLPFGGFNGPVLSIIKGQGDKVIFGGSFDGLGNTTTPSLKDQQMINLETAEISAGGSNIRPGLGEPRNIVCKASKRDGEGTTWLLSDQQAGFWNAQMKFGYQPTKLRLWNTRFEGRGTRTFRFIALPDSGILNLTYTDPKTGAEMACDARCPLSDDPAEEFRDFHFVNIVGMSGFRLEIIEFYGQGGGLNGIELFQDDIYAYAVNSFNEPTCANIPFASSSTNTGSWTVIPDRQSSDFLSAQVDSLTSASTSVSMFPDIKQSGNYSVTIFTPGCIKDGTCATRGIVNVTGNFFAQSDSPVQTFIHQTNNFDKYDQIYLGRVDAGNGNFRPRVTVSAQTGQGTINVVASRVRFQLISSTGGLNGLYEYDPKEKQSSTNFSSSAVNRAGTDLGRGALVDSLIYVDNTLFVGGNFSNSTIHNILSLRDGRASGLNGEGLNAAVTSLISLDNVVYAGGNFTDLSKGGNSRLRHVAAYTPSDDTWLPLGSGVNGIVRTLVLLPVNVSSSRVETAIAVSGDFSQIEASDGRRAIPAKGFAVWVPSRKKWLQELDINQMAYAGQLTTSILERNDTILAGTLASGGISSHGAVALTDKNGLALQPLPVKIQQTSGSSSGRKRAVLNRDGSQSVTTGLFDKGSGRNNTILVGHFTAMASDGSDINNVLLIDGADGDKVTGLKPGIQSNSTFLSAAVHRDSLFLGGKVTGRVRSSNTQGLVVYDLAKKDYLEQQPGLLDGSNVVINSISPRPGSDDIYVGGEFDTASSLPCPGVCTFQTGPSQWVRPGTNLQGAISSLIWASKEKLIAAGNITVGGNRTTLANFDAKTQTWSTITGKSSDLITGPVTALGLARQDGSRLWVAGKSASGSTFLVYYDGTEFRSPGSLFGEQTTILGLQILGLRENHEETPFLERRQALLLTGQIQLPRFGMVSGAIYNGTTVEPLILSSTSDGKPGSISGLFSENEIKISGSRQGLSRGIVVLISFCIALGCIFLIVLIGIILGRIRRRRQGYVSAPQGMDRKPDLRRLPPEYLLDSIRQRAPGVPAI